MLSRGAGAGRHPVDAIAGPRPNPAAGSHGDEPRRSDEHAGHLRIEERAEASRTGAAVYVITQEDIRRSGATNIPDLLRMVPGVDVARVDHNNWAISIRGFSDIYANKVLVLIDGRSVYQPVFSGVIWHQQDVPLEDIDRIEVIRGPGATVWGANAVNGVINIITKSAKETEGGLVSAGGGSREAAEGLVQYGEKIGNVGAYRVFGRYSNIGNSDSANGAQAADARSMSHAGFRSDWDLSPRDTLTVQGDFLQAHGGRTETNIVSLMPPLIGTFADPIRDYSGNILGRWTHTYSNGSDMSLQVYEDKSQVLASGARNSANVVNADFQHHLSIGSRNDVVWGLGYRSSANRFAGTDLVSVNPSQRTDELFSVFVEDEITLTHSLSLTLGSKFEHNAYTGYESEPSAQLVWTPTSRQTIWASAAKAIRQPANADSGIQAVSSLVLLRPAGFVLVTVFGNPNTKVEELHDFETGYRAQLSRRVSLDLTAFRSYYKHLRTNEPQAPLLRF